MSSGATKNWGMAGFYNKDRLVFAEDAPEHAAVGSALALAGDAQGRAVVDAGGDADLEVRLAPHAPGAAAVLARVLDDLALAAASGTRLRHRKEALRHLDAPGAAALRAAL